MTEQGADGPITVENRMTCICVKPIEYPHVHPECPTHGRLTPTTGSYDLRNQYPLRQCTRCQRWWFMPEDVCHECQDVAR